jgi:hypothetical protein
MYLVRKCKMYIQCSYDFTFLTLTSNWKSRIFCQVATKPELKKGKRLFSKGKSSLVVKRDGGKCYEFETVK